jgi:putative MATE family efflux protein
MRGKGRETDAPGTRTARDAVSETLHTERSSELLNAPPARAIFRFALPLMAGGACQQIYALTDAAVVGRVLGVDALSALGACDLLVWLVGAALSAFTQGFSIRLATAFGAGDRELFRRIATTSAWLCAVCAVLLCTAAEICAPLVLRAMQVQPEIWDYALTYLRTIYAGIPFLMFYHFFSGVLRAVGNSRDPLRAMLISSVLNIVLDIAVVVFLNGGIFGAAAATVFSQAISAVYIACRVRKRLGTGKERLCFDRKLIRPMMCFSVLMTVQTAVSAVGGLVVQAVVNTYSIPYIAGYAATNKLYGLLEFAAVSYGYAITTYTGQNFGAENKKRVQQGLLAGECLALATAACFSLIIFIADGPLVSVFLSGDAGDVAAALAVGRKFLRIMGVGMPMLYTTHLTRSFVQGLGHSALVTAASIAELLIRLASAFTLRSLLGDDCVLYAEAFAWTIGTLLTGTGAVFYARRLSFPPRHR